MDNEDETVSSTSEVAPTHYTLKVQSFSLLAKTTLEKYESGTFEAGGYKWRLVMHPNGNKSKNCKEHVSLYLAIADTDSLAPGWEVYVVYRLFLLNQKKDKYLILQDAVGKEKRFHATNREWGYHRFLPLRSFTDATNGFLVDDTCVFGADVFVSRERSRGKGESLSMIKDKISNKYVWKVENFSKLAAQSYCSPAFYSGDHKWNIHMYPKGNRHGMSSHVSLYLSLADSEPLLPTTKIYAEFSIRILDQAHGRNHGGTASHWFNNSSQERGWVKFVSLGYFNNPSNGFLVKDGSLVEAEVTVLATAEAL